MSIVPLPVFEADADPQHRTARTDEEIYADLKAPTSMVVRFGRMKLVGEYAYTGDAKPGCGSKIVARTHRGTEVTEMLTSTCPNSGCGKSVSRSEMLDYIESSGGKQYPFHTKGKILRVATIEDLNAQSALEDLRLRAIASCKELINSHELPMKLVEAEPILGNELLTFYYMSEDRVDFRDLVKDLASEFATRIEMVQVGARDEARLVADYERCGQHCCCKNFLKVLKPVSMGAAKRQKASLEPLKISGRCGRLMCCLRYEDQTYKDLKANLPHRKTRVGTPDGPGIVVDSKVLVQLVLVKLEANGLESAYPVEDLMDPDAAPIPKPEVEDDPFRGMDTDEVKKRSSNRDGKGRSKRSRQERYKKRSQKTEGETAQGTAETTDAAPDQSAATDAGEPRTNKKRRRRRRRSGKDGKAPQARSGGPKSAPDTGKDSSSGSTPDGSDNQGGKSSGQRRRRRRGRRGGRGRGGPKPDGGGGGGGGGSE